MTAVWIQISTIQVKQSHGTEALAQAAAGLEADIRFTGRSSLDFTLKKNGRVFKKTTIKDATPEAVVAKLDTTISSLKLGSSVSAAMVSPAVSVPYGSMVAVLDVLRKHQIINIGVVPVRDETAGK